MKPIFGIIFFSALIGCTGPYLAGYEPIPESERTFERIVEAPGYSKDQIFTNTKIWIAETFKSSKAVLEYENKEDGVIIGNGITSYPCSGMDCIAKGNWKVPFTMRVDIKDQKFRVTFINLRISKAPSYDAYTGVSPGFDSPVTIRGYMDAIKPKLLEFGDQLLASFGKEKSKSNW